MKNELLRPIIVAPILFILLIAAVLVMTTRHESAGTSHSVSSNSSPLKVSPDGSRATTNVSGADLQQAAPPASSVTTTDVSPQQASPYQEGF